MTNLNKYRRLSIIAVIILVITWLLSLAWLWNSLRNVEVKHEGWLMFFIILVLILGLLLFYIAYHISDNSLLEKIRKEAFELGKAELLKESEKKEETAINQSMEEEDEQKVKAAIMKGINSVRSVNSFCNKLLINLSNEMGYVQGIMYVKNKKDGIFNPSGEYALTDRKPQSFKEGETLPGQVASNKSSTILYDVPEDYFIVASGLGSSKPRFLLLVPVMLEDQCIAVLELASFRKPDESAGRILDQLLSDIGLKLNKLITA